jgi:hypothetical protein
MCIEAASNYRLKLMARLFLAEPQQLSRSVRLLILCTLVPLLFSSCAGGNATQRKSFIEGLYSEIGFATLDDLISEMGPPKESTETPEGIWYTWRKVYSGAVSGGFSVGFFSMMMGTPVETGEELNCLFDHDTGRLSDYNFREW